MKKLAPVILILAGITVIYVFLKSPEESEAKNEIHALLNKQVACWNKADINCFMKGYWESDSLMFIGSGGITYGYKNTEERYKKNYPDKEAMGELSFEILETKKITTDCYLVVGKFHLKRENIGDLEGIFTLTFRKILGNWLIVADHTG